MPKRGLVLLCGWSLLVACASPPCPPTTPTPPPQGTVRYVIGGDSRNDTSSVLPWAFAEAKARGASGFFFLGDMELTPGFDTKFENELGGLAPVPFYPVLGNHEVQVFGFLSIGRKESESKFRKRFLDQPRSPATTSFPDKVVYSVDLPGRLHFVALDNVSQDGFGDDQLRWLAADIEGARKSPNVKYIVVGMHKPLAGNGVTTHSMAADGQHAIDDSNAALEVMKAGHVDLIVASHLHQFTQFEQGGIPSYITGGLGAPLTASGEQHAFHHFLELDVSEESIHIDVVRFPGKSAIGNADDGDEHN
jgi:hypothetical protein